MKDLDRTWRRHANQLLISVCPEVGLFINDSQEQNIQPSSSTDTQNDSSQNEQFLRRSTRIRRPPDRLNL